MAASAHATETSCLPLRASMLRRRCPGRGQGCSNCQPAGGQAPGGQKRGARQLRCAARNPSALVHPAASRSRADTRSRRLRLSHLWTRQDLPADVELCTIHPDREACPKRVTSNGVNLLQDRRRHVPQGGERPEAAGSLPSCEGWHAALHGPGERTWSAQWHAHRREEPACGRTRGAATRWGE